MQLLNDRQRLDWIRLSFSENVGPQTFRQLMARFGSAAAALEALPTLSRQGGLKRPLVLMPQVKAEQAVKAAEAMGARFVVAGEDGYPPLLTQIEDAPPVLCVKGQDTHLKRTSIGIVGSRNASASGLKLTRQLAGALAEEGFLITSGLARGIDTAAHAESQRIATAAVIASGLDIIYPPENADLQRQIGERGLLISEALPGQAPLAQFFPRRNRIISGMSKAVIVVEAALRSGSLITARQAAEQGRDVYAVPGSPLDPRAAGTNKLIRDGAVIVTSVNELIDDLKSARHSAMPAFAEPPAVEFEPEPSQEDRQRIVDLLSATACDLDDLVRESSLSTANVVAVLLELELAGVVARAGRGQVHLLA